MSKKAKGLLSDLDHASIERDEFVNAVLVDDPEGRVGQIPIRRALGRAAVGCVVTSGLAKRLKNGDPIVLVIETPNPDWTSAIGSAVRHLFKDAEVISPLQAPSRSFPLEGSQIHLPTIVITSDRNWVHPSRINAADVLGRVRITPALVARAIQLATGRKPRIRREDIAGLDFWELAAAVRPGDRPIHAVKRLRAMAGRMLAMDESRDKPLLEGLVGFGKSLPQMLAIAADIRRSIDDAPNDAELPSVLMFGPPGVGKTMLAGAFARSVGMPLIATSVAGWFSSSEGHLGDVVKAAQRAFDQAMAAAPAVFFRR